MNDIKNASNLYCFASRVFEVFGMKWYIGFWPNGSRVSREGTVNIFLNLVSFETPNTKIPIQFDLTWIESGKTSSNYDTFSIDGNGGGETFWPLTTVDAKQ